MNTPHRVLHIIDHLNTGGAQVILLRLLTGMDRECWAPIVCCLHGNGPYVGQLQDQGVTVHSLGRRGDPRVLWRLAQMLHTVQPHLVHLHLETSTFLGAPLARAMTGARTAVSIYGLRNQYPAWVFPLLRTMSCWIGAYVVGGRALERELLAAGFPPSKLRFISLLATELAGDLPDGAARRAAARRAEGLAADTPVLLRVARLHPQKGHGLLIDAMPRVVQEIPNVQLLIVGDGPLETKLHYQVANLGLEGVVRFLGFRLALCDLYLASDVVVISSQREGIGLTTVEAMALGRPVVASNVGGVSEVIRHAETGLLVPPDDPVALADALVALLRDGERRQQLGTAARSLIQREYSVPHMVAEHERLYADLIQEKT